VWEIVKYLRQMIRLLSDIVINLIKFGEGYVFSSIYVMDIRI